MSPPAMDLMAASAKRAVSSNSDASACERLNDDAQRRVNRRSATLFGGASELNGGFGFKLTLYVNGA